MNMRRQPNRTSPKHTDEDRQPAADHGDLLPWADPYIARLLAKHRLQAALDDSLNFLADDTSERHLEPTASRFGRLEA